jgi:hypothetical protein
MGQFAYPSAAVRRTVSIGQAVTGEVSILPDIRQIPSAE